MHRYMHYSMPPPWRFRLGINNTIAIWQTQGYLLIYICKRIIVHVLDLRIFYYFHVTIYNLADLICSVIMPLEVNIVMPT